MKIRIEYDDDQLNIIERVNEALKEHGLEFVVEDEYHDGYEILELKKIS